MKVWWAQACGFCAGVVRAIEIVECALQKYGPSVCTMPGVEESTEFRLPAALANR